MSNVIEISRLRKSNVNSHTRSHGQGSIKKVSGSKNLYFDFYYYGTRVRKSSGFPDSTEGWTMAEQAMDQIIDEIQRGVFNFAKRFPFGSDKEKQFFSELEGRDYSAPPHDVTFGEYYSKWKEQVWGTFTESKKRDYESRINYHLIPFFGTVSFSQITKVKMKEFVAHLSSPTNRNKKPLKRSTIENVLIPLREIYYDAVDEYGWDLPDPFSRLGRVIPKGQPEPVQIFTFEEWIQILGELYWPYVPSAEFSVMTGLRPSELAGLRESVVTDSKVINVQNSIVRKREKATLKTPGSERDFEVWPRLQAVIDEQIEVKRRLRKDSLYLFINSDGNPFNIDLFREYAWKSALKRTKVPYRKPYTMRHTFAAWMLLFKHPAEVARLMGHSSKKMVYEVYGKFVKGLEKEREEIKAYLGLEDGCSAREEQRQSWGQFLA